jgi:hypothetical protein
LPKATLRSDNPDDSVKMDNYYDMEYLGPLYIGTEGYEGWYAYDTGSSYLVVESENCATCKGDGF